MSLNDGIYYVAWIGSSPASSHGMYVLRYLLDEIEEEALLWKRIHGELLPVRVVSKREGFAAREHRGREETLMFRWVMRDRWRLEPDVENGKPLRRHEVERLTRR